MGNTESMKKSRQKRSSSEYMRKKKPKGQRSDKPRISREHAIERANDHYDLELTMADVERVELRIRTKDECLFLEKTTNTRSLWLMWVENVLCVVVYNTNQKCLSTFLPRNRAKRYFHTDENGKAIPWVDTGEHKKQ